MPKALICTLNSKYIHSSLAPWCIFSSAKKRINSEISLSVFEGTINEKQEDVLERILLEAPDAISFSSYIWNISFILSLTKKIKSALPNIKIILGGPEVAFCSEKILLENSEIDFVLSGEGEESFPALLENIFLYKNNSVKGLTQRNGNEFLKTPFETLDLSSLPSPYGEEYLSRLKGRIAYIESSRGCPFSCAFCLSGKEGKVRFFPMERVKSDMITLVSFGAKTVKFIDRTFNCNEKRAKEILLFIKENYEKLIPGDVCFHFEIAADILSEDLMEIISEMPVGSVQFEAGIQSFNEKTLNAVFRKTDLNRLSENIRRLVKNKNSHIHIDLIAGLPFEDMKSFIDSFNKAYSLGANMLQLGFLKVLHGSPMGERRELFPCEYSPDAPYEITSTPWLSGEDLKLLHLAERELERLYNSGKFTRTLEFVLAESGMKAFDLFLSFGEYLNERGYSERIPLDEYTSLAFDYFSKIVEDKIRLRDVMVFDRILKNNSDIMPEKLKVKDESLSFAKRYFLKAYPRRKGEKRTVALLYSEKKAVLVKYDFSHRITGEYEPIFADFEDVFNNTNE